MARFSVYAANGVTGYLLDVQTDLLDNLTTRVVIPLLPLDAAPPRLARMNPVFEIEGVEYAMATEYIAAVPRKALTTTVADLSGQSEQITAAVDFLMQGY